ncbi:DUF1801 domain-containing protein [Devosia sp. CC-YST696]|nr:DUF1801 domain-containing protein [Devosia faecipullorum]
MPGWKRGIGETIDAVISREIPGVEKAVKWNSPFYGMEKDVWFLNVHCFDKYVKITFFAGASLVPAPEGKSKYPAIRHLNICEGDEFETRLADWVRQASLLPGEKM